MSTVFHDVTKIYYRGGYKYQLAEDHHVQLVERDFCNWTQAKEDEFAVLYPRGLLVVRKGYAWDGPSGPTIDTPNFMRGSLVHDALYQLMRESFLPAGARKAADKELYRICREDGMAWPRAQWIYWSVRAFGALSADPDNKRKVRSAP